MIASNFVNADGCNRDELEPSKRLYADPCKMARQAMHETLAANITYRQPMNAMNVNPVCSMSRSQLDSHRCRWIYNQDELKASERLYADPRQMARLIHAFSSYT